MMAFKDMANGTFDHAKCRESENIKLNEAEGLKVADVLAFCPWGLKNPSALNKGHMTI